MSYLIKIIKDIYLDVDDIRYTDNELRILIQELQEHQMIGYAYNHIHNVSSNEEMRRELKMHYISIDFQIRTQKLIAKQISDILIQNSVRHVFFKGLLLGSYYGLNQKRQMTDIDILIDKSDYKNAMLILSEYASDIEYGPKHDVIRINGVNIEVHKSLIDYGLLNMSDDLDKLFISNKRMVDLDGLQLCYPLPQYHFLYMIIHMIVHLKNASFGIKQVVDLCYFVKNNDVDLDDAYQYFCDCGLEIAYSNIIAVCHVLLGFDVKESSFNKWNVKTTIVHALINQIVSEGAFGHSGPKSFHNYSYNHYFTSIRTDVPRSFIGRLRAFLFPYSQELTDTYMYAKEKMYLLPVAWIHRFSRLFFRSDISVKMKLFFLFMDKKAIQDKHVLLDEMNLI